MHNPLDIDRDGHLTPTDGAFAQMYRDDYRRTRRLHRRVGCGDGCLGCAGFALIAVMAVIVLGVVLMAFRY